MLEIILFGIILNIVIIYSFIIIYMFLFWMIQKDPVSQLYIINIKNRIDKIDLKFFSLICLPYLFILVVIDFILHIEHPILNIFYKINFFTYK